MNTQSNAVPEASRDSQRIAPAAMSATRPLYWSVRRELWENRSLYIAPLAVAAVSVVRLPDQPDIIRREHAWTGGARPGASAHRARHALQPRCHAAHADRVHRRHLLLLDALHGERRDRSILFWKSLPVSDLTTVLAKAEHSARGSAAARLRDHRCPAADHAGC